MKREIEREDRAEDPQEVRSIEDRIIKEERLIKDEEARSVFNKVFDRATLTSVYELARKKFFEEVEFIISTGKEGNVFRCHGGDNFYALKIFKVSTSEFRHMQNYIIGDERFKDIRKDKLEIIKLWTKKEFRNLEEFAKAKIRAPLPIASNRNCLLMEFIGKEGIPAPRAKDKPFEEPEKQYHILCDYMAKMVNAKLIHADLSEYNILNNDEELVIIDVGQAVTTMHPNAKEFFERDVLNLSKYFKKQGVDTDYEKMYAEIKKLSGKMKIAFDKTQKKKKY
ncbi:RIO-type serine/threonine-protein kinase Rio1 [uncultured archaeon]|nr:RIO-type serine/threonine-protein kinase Rio1 [uncultured archaeon]